jgi:hypothetical protein
MASGTYKISGALQMGAMASAPASPVQGLIYYDSALQEFRLYAGGGFKHIADFSVLGSTANGEGASTIGIEDVDGNFTATNVEAALAELYEGLATAGATTFDEAMFRIYKTGAPTTELIFSLTALTADRTITMPDSNVNLGLVATAIQRDGSVAFTANQPMGGFKLTGLAAGTSAGDSVRYEQAILISGANAFAANQPMGGFKFTGLGAGSGAGDSVRYEQVILVNGANAFTADQSLGGFKITNLGAPSAGGDATNKTYVDGQIANYINGVKPKQAARVAADVDVDIATELENGDTLDSIVLATGDRVLLTAQTAPEDNGVYVVQASGAAIRSSDFDSLTPIDEINGAYLPIQEGTYQGALFVQYGTVSVIGTDPINFTYIPAVTSIVGGDMISVLGNIVSVDLATVSGLESTNPGNNAGQLRIKLEASNPSLQISGSNELGAKLYSGGALVKNSSGLLVNTDGTTIEIATNALQIKDNGVSDAKFRQSAGLSVVGRSANSTGNVADITAAVDGQVLRRSGTSIGFGLLVDANIDAAAAIAGTKVSPDFGSQNIRTTGQIRQGSASNDVEEFYLHNQTLNGSASGTALATLTFNGQTYKSLVIIYNVVDTVSNNRRTGILYVSADNASGVTPAAADATDTGGDADGDPGVQWAAAISGTDVEVRYTTTANNKTLNAKVFRIRA